MQRIPWGLQMWPLDEESLLYSWEEGQSKILDLHRGSQAQLVMAGWGWEAGTG